MLFDHSATLTHRTRQRGHLRRHLFQLGQGDRFGRIRQSFLLIGMLYCFYALYASGLEAVFGAALVMIAGYLLFGIIAKRLVAELDKKERAL